MSGWVDLKIFFPISPLQRFSGFPYLFTTFWGEDWKEGRLSWPHTIFVRISLLYHFSRFPYLLLFERCQAELTSHFCSRISPIHHFSESSYLLTTSSKDVRLSWPQKCFLVSCLFTNFQDFLTELLLLQRMSGWVDLKVFLDISVCCSQSGFWPDLTSTSVLFGSSAASLYAKTTWHNVTDVFFS